MTVLNGFESGISGYIGLFIGILLIYEGLWQLLTRSEAQAKARNRRMKMIARGATADDVLKVMKPNQDEWWLRGLPFISRIPSDLRQAGITMAPLNLVLICGAGAVITAVFAALRLPSALAGGLALGLWIMLPLLFLRVMRNRRLDQFSRQLPDALDLMARGLRVGHPLNVTIASVAEEMSDPVASEFGIIVDQVSYGDTLVDAVFDLSRRMQTEDAQYLASSISIQHGTGGDLARILSVLSTVIRGRNALRRKVKAISAEGRLSARFLSAIPLLMGGVMSVITPSYYGSVSSDPAFRPAAAAVVILILLNALILRRLVNFRV
ncbi:type II secretion system F family protein [Solirhodobacter olei]|uniref:type II secretion system F family protein n=1 Tax=Solirhodobacter olei TaxID=2493082 RepID=UPI0013E37FC2|nr:type II secretion system F family protein [Solirhodobacter olei]